MIKKLLFLFTILYGINFYSQTTLATGDLAIIGLDTQNTDFIFVTFVDLEEGTIIYFSDKTADGDYTLDQTIEGHLRYTVPVGGITAGTVVHRNTTDFLPDGTGTFSLSNLGDNLIAYQGTSVGNVTTYLHAVAENSAKMGTFPAGFTATLILLQDDGKYVGTRTGETASSYFNLINDINNWVIAANGVPPFDETGFSITITPGVTVSENNLYDFFYYEGNGPSVVQTVNVTGENLIDDINLTVPEFYEFSLSPSSGFSETLTLTSVDGTVESTTIYIRLKSGLLEEGYNSVITVTSTNTTTKTVNLFGEVVPRPPLTLQTIWSGPLSTGLPNGIEVYVREDIEDMSIYGLGSTNDGTGYFGQEFTFPAVSANAGDFIVITDDADLFQEFFGFAADYVDPVAAISGNDAVQLLAFGDVIDSYGYVGTNGEGSFWDYNDGWASRIQGTGPDGELFNPNNWTISGTGVLTGAAINSDATQPVPLGGFLVNWVGLVDTDWANAGNWSPNRIPTASDNVYINVSSNKPIINGNFTISNLYLFDQLTINSGSLTTTGNVDGTSGFIRVESGASLLTYGAITGDDHVVIRNTTFDESTGKYSVVGAPVSGVTTEVLGKLVYAYDETIDYDLNLGNDRFYQVTNVPMPAGEGFFSAFTGTVIFEGNPHTGTYTIPLVYNTSQDGANAGFNLVSNPYPAAIDVIEMFFENFATINSQIYIWADDNPPGTQGTNEDYITYNSLGTVGPNGNTFNGYIGTAQGFFVKANSNGSLEFNNAMKVVGENGDEHFFRRREGSDTRYNARLADIRDGLQKVKLSVTNTSNEQYNEILIGFVGDATTGQDQLYDAAKFMGNTNLQLYSYIENVKFAIQGLPTLDGDQTVGLGMDIGTSGNYQLKLEEVANLPEGIKIYIQDKELNTFTEIAAGMPFNFSSDAIVNSSKYNLVFTSNATLGLENKDVHNNVSIIGTDDKLIIKTKNGVVLNSAEIQVTDVLGRIVLSNKISEPFNFKEIKHNFEKNNLYIVELKSQLGTVAKKIIIK